MGNNHIVTVERSGLSVAQVGGNDVYKMLHQLRSIIELCKLEKEYSLFFAEPVEGDRVIDWYAEEDGPAIQVTQLPQEERLPVLQQFQSMVQTLQNQASKLREQSGSYRSYADMLEKALIIPNLNSLYIVNRKPVLVNWAFSECDSELAESRSLMKQIEKAIDNDELEKKRQEEEERLRKEQEEIEKLQREQRKEEKEEGLQKEQEAVEKLQREQQKEETAQDTQKAAKSDVLPVHSKKKSLLFKILIAVLIFALIVAALCFFLCKKSEMGFLKDEIVVEGALTNENGEDVVLRLHFPDKDGKGTSTIEEKDQSCQGTVHARFGADKSSIQFELTELVCPKNGNNYDPFSLVCIRGQNSCIGTNRNGETWKVDVEIEEGGAR